MLLSDLEILKHAELGMIQPFVAEQVREIDGRAAISFGLSGYGYDARLSDQDIWVSKSAAQVMAYDHAKSEDHPLEINAKRFTLEREMQPGVIDEDQDGRYFHIPARGCCLCRSVEWFDLPPMVTGFVFEKSTNSRAFLIGLMTPAEAGWAGHYVFEFFNPWDRPYRMAVNEGIAQFVFARGEPAAMPYSMRKNPKYQNQIFSGPKV